MVVLSQLDIVGNGFFRINQWMPCLFQYYLTGLAEQRQCCLGVMGHFSLGIDKIKMSQNLGIILNVQPIRSQHRWKSCQDSSDLLPFLDLRLTQTIIQINCTGWLNIQRLTTSALIMNYPAKTASLTTQHWQHITFIADRNNRLA